MTFSEVEQTINYAKFFGSRLTPKHLHLWLISPKKSSPKQLSNFLSKNPQLKKKLISKPNHHQTKLVRQKIKNVQKLLSVFKIIQNIKLVALTGSLSIDNPKKNDDIDLMIIVSPNTLWLTRPLVIFLTSLLSNRRKPNTSNSSNQVCLNLWLDQTALTVPKSKQNLYTAHEVLQVKPLLDRGGVYRQFILSNSWTKKHLANAYKRMSLRRVCECTLPEWQKRWVTAFLRGLLRGGTRQLNLLAFHLQHLYMKSKITHELITPHAAYFHPRSLYPEIKKSLKQTV